MSVMIGLRERNFGEDIRSEWVVEPVSGALQLRFRTGVCAAFTAYGWTGAGMSNKGLNQNINVESKH